MKMYLFKNFAICSVVLLAILISFITPMFQGNTYREQFCENHTFLNSKIMRLEQKISLLQTQIENTTFFDPKAFVIYLHLSQAQQKKFKSFYKDYYEEFIAAKNMHRKYWHWLHFIDQVLQILDEHQKNHLLKFLSALGDR